MMDERVGVDGCAQAGVWPVGRSAVGCAAALRALLTALALLAIVMLPLLTAISPAEAATTEAQAAPPPVRLALLFSSRRDTCYDRGDVAAIRRLATLEQERINRSGGIHGRRLELEFLDDARDAKRSIANIRAALSDPQTLAMIGLTRSSQAEEVFGAIGKDIAASGIPFLSDISVNSIFAEAPNTYTTRPSQDEERLPPMLAFAETMGFSSFGSLALANAIYSSSLADGLKSRLRDRLTADVRLTLTEEKLDPAEVDAAIAEIAARSPQLLFLTVGGARSGEVLKKLVAAKVTPAIFLTGRIENLPPEIRTGYPAPIYQLTWDELPDLDNERLRALISQGAPEDWVFGGAKIPEAPGWAAGECTERADDLPPNPSEMENLRAIARGSQYADMVGLVAAAAMPAGPGSSVGELRSRVLKELATTYAAGRGAYRGSFQNWSFQNSSRSAMRMPFIIILPQGLGRTQLAPIQFIRQRDGSLRAIDTLYLDIDMIRAHRVEDSEKTFFAEFHLSMRDNGRLKIEDIDFTSAYLDPRTNGRQLTIEPLHDGGPSSAYPDSMKIYRIAGRFVFEPDLSTYPFDTQRFAIDLQPRKGEKPFIVQPPPISLRDRSVETDGWDAVEQYVGYAEDFIPMIDAFTHAPSIVPFYKASYAWLMKRQTTDYFLRVVVPLAFILIVAYLSIFIPQSHFEAIVTIQVTALLSAVALYLSLPQLDADTATLSDRIFVFDYMMVSAMIVISILRINQYVAARKWLKRSLEILHIVVFPLVIAVMAIWVYGLGNALF